jgi:hypothetical protein
MRKKNWSSEEDEILRKNFKIMSLMELTRVLPDRNYNSIKARQTYLKLCPIYTKDDSFFSTPNVLNSSIAGFIASDGHISPPKEKRSARICFGVNTKDKRILEYVNFYLKSNYTITDSIKEAVFKSKDKKTYTYIDYKTSLHISKAEKLAQDLLYHWNIPSGAKSLTLDKPNLLDLDVSLAYIKGLIIGDGSIIKTSFKGADYVRISLLGTENLLNWVKLILSKFLGESMDNIKVKPERVGAKVFCLSISGLKASRIVHKLNQLDTLTLNRKFKKPEVLAIIKKDINKNPELFI